MSRYRSSEDFMPHNERHALRGRIDGLSSSGLKMALKMRDTGSRNVMKIPQGLMGGKQIGEKKMS